MGSFRRGALKGRVRSEERNLAFLSRALCHGVCNGEATKKLERRPGRR